MRGHPSHSDQSGDRLVISPFEAACVWAADIRPLHTHIAKRAADRNSAHLHRRPALVATERTEPDADDRGL